MKAEESAESVEELQDVLRVAGVLWVESWGKKCGDDEAVDGGLWGGRELASDNLNNRCEWRCVLVYDGDGEEVDWV